LNTDDTYARKGPCVLKAGALRAAPKKRLAEQFFGRMISNNPAKELLEF
jgi:hypothetical protein